MSHILRLPLFIKLNIKDISDANKKYYKANNLY